MVIIFSFICYLHYKVTLPHYCIVKYGNSKAFLKLLEPALTTGKMCTWGKMKCVNFSWRELLSRRGISGGSLISHFPQKGKFVRDVCTGHRAWWTWHSKTELKETCLRWKEVLRNKPGLCKMLTPSQQFKDKVFNWESPKSSPGSASHSQEFPSLVVLSWGVFASQGTLINVWRYFGLSQWGECAAGIEVGRGQGCY